MQQMHGAANNITVPIRLPGRQTRLKLLAEEEKTMIFYETPYRIVKTLTQFMEFFGEDRMISVSRELTKMHEETIRGTIKEVVEYYNNNVTKGEIVIILRGAEK